MQLIDTKFIERRYSLLLECRWNENIVHYFLRIRYMNKSKEIGFFLLQIPHLNYEVNSRIEKKDKKAKKKMERKG